jgi:hypothetical protein
MGYAMMATSDERRATDEGFGKESEVAMGIGQMFGTSRLVWDIPGLI